MPKIINYYTKSNYGQNHEYIHPNQLIDAQIIRELTGKKTITQIYHLV